IIHAPRRQWPSGSGGIQEEVKKGLTGLSTAFIEAGRTAALPFCQSLEELFDSQRTTRNDPAHTFASMVPDSLAALHAAPGSTISPRPTPEPMSASSSSAAVGKYSCET